MVCQRSLWLTPKLSSKCVNENSFAARHKKHQEVLLCLNLRALQHSCALFTNESLSSISCKSQPIQWNLNISKAWHHKHELFQSVTWFNVNECLSFYKIIGRLPIKIEAKTLFDPRTNSFRTKHLKLIGHYWTSSHTPIQIPNSIPYP